MKELTILSHNVEVCVTTKSLVANKEGAILANMGKKWPTKPEVEISTDHLPIVMSFQRLMGMGVSDGSELIGSDY
jgi:hypothetical protein